MVEAPEAEEMMEFRLKSDNSKPTLGANARPSCRNKLEKQTPRLLGLTPAVKQGKGRCCHG